VVKKSQKELEHWRIQFMFNDRRVVYAQVRAKFDKVKDDLDVALLSMQKPFDNLVCTNGVLVKSIDDTTKHDHVPRVSYLQQLHFEERNYKQAKSKLDCRECGKTYLLARGPTTSTSETKSCSKGYKLSLQGISQN
jgi:hypothetical protein